MNALRRLFSRINAFLFPVHGWSDRVRDYRNGNVTWQVEGRSDIAPLVPWPLEWIAAEVLADSPELRFHDHVSLVSGKECVGHDAVKCSRCGIPLHTGEAHMTDSLSVPACSWCVGAVNRAR